MIKTLRYLKSLGALCLALAAGPVAAQTTCSLSSPVVNYQANGGVNISVSQSTGGTFTWLFGNGDTQSGSNLNPVSETYTANGSYTVTVYFIDSLATCSTTLTIPVSITNVCPLNANFVSTNGANGIVTFTSAAALAAGGPVPGVLYFWTFGDGGTASGSGFTDFGEIHTYTANGNYVASLFVMDSSSVLSCSVLSQATINVTNATSSPAPCYLNSNYYNLAPPSSNGQLMLTNNTSGTSASTTYTWDYGDGTYSYAASPGPHTYTASGTYTVILTAYDPTFASPCLSSSWQVFTVILSNCSLSANFSASQSGGVINFNNTTTGTSGTTTYYWYFSNGTSSNSSTTATATYTASGVYTVVLMAIDSSFVPACTSSSTQFFTVNVNPTFTCSINASYSYTQAGSGVVNFNSTSTGVSPYATYFWYFGDGGSATGSSASHTYGSNGTYYAYLTVLDSNGVNVCTDSTTQIITITSGTCVANAGFNLSPSGTPQIWNASPVAPANITNAVWSWGDGTSTDTLYTSHNYATAGSYYICLSVTVSCGATDSSCSSYAIYRTMSTAQSKDIIRVNVINPAAPLGIKNASLDNAAFNISPNPNNGSFHLNVNGLTTGNAAVSIYSAVGDLVYKTEQETSNGVFVKDVQLNQVANGVYFIKISSNGQSVTKKMIINKN